ncbi:MAG: DUF6352 family protein [Pseudomonadota bacterium]
MNDFWRDSGYHLLARDSRGHLTVTDDYLRAYFRRPEVRPVEESCAAERALHEALLADPRRPVGDAELAGMADPDAREAYGYVLGLRDRLVAAGTLEKCYLDLVLEGARLPSLFLDQMVQAVARAMLEGCEDGLRVRAAELLFRAQKVTINDGHIMAADHETVEMYATSGGFGTLGQLVTQTQTPLRTVELDVVDEHNADLYWSRDQSFDTVLNLNFAGAGLDALCRALETWVAHFLSVKISIQPVQQIRDQKWVWHVGLDAEGSALLNDLYNGLEVGEARLARLLSLFRMEFADPSVVAERVAGRPVYLAMAMTESGLLRVKPQNLLVNLPLAERA